MDKTLQQLLDNNFSDLKGATAQLSIPISQALINELIRTALKGNRNIASTELSIHPQNRVTVNLKTTMIPWPLSLKLKLDKAVDLASYSSPKMRAWMENNRLLGSLGTMLNAMPEGIKLYGDQVVVDLGAFLKAPEQKRLLKLVKFVGIDTEEGKVILNVDVEVD